MLVWVQVGWGIEGRTGNVGHPIPVVSADSEFDRYIGSAQSPVAVDALSYWQQHQLEFPRCASIARKYLAMPATSVQSERLFSATGRLISKSRSRLLPERAECLVFLN